MEENFINFKISLEQAQLLCKYYGKDIKTLNEYDISELLDSYISELSKLV